ncbi:hypothetical protein [Phenylobacterium aquaticum]|uniref:hypothetical protein n=1 Tax=Phenylobacterium aquaticum TaxID=1763816 RepID=UPI0026EF11FA|nr:hypothetical protein [Phenylobacterium aquaticum]
MDIHKPKAAHNWREFLIEIGTIVCGILIALGLEQAVESAHWAKKVREAKSSIHRELVQATVFGEERIHQQDCRETYLAELTTAIISSPAHWTPRPKVYCGTEHDSTYSGLERPWPTETWRSIVAEGTVSHFSDTYRRQAPFVFNFIEFINNRALEETQEAYNLNALDYKIDITPDAKIRFLNSIRKLRNQNELVPLLCQQLIGAISGLGEKPSEEELEQTRAKTPYYRGGLPMKHAAQPRAG